MPSIDVYSQDKSKVGTASLVDDVFGVEVNDALIWEAVHWGRAKRRAGTQSTKTRTEVRGGRKKPYKQKGTGRARQGSIKGPHQRGGGIAFGPKPRSYDYQFPKAKRRGALRSALSLRLRDKQLWLVDNLELQAIKTARIKGLLAKFGLGKTLIVDTENDKLRLSTRNLHGAMYLSVNGLNTLEIINHPNLVISKAAAAELGARLSETARRQAAAAQG